eukprot:3410738-Karenia_brevis.AAC.1
MQLKLKVEGADKKVQDIKVDEAAEVAESVTEEAGVDKDSYNCTQGVDGAGRLAKTLFVNNSKLQEARMKVNALKKQTSTMPNK